MQKPLGNLRFARDHRWSERHMSKYIDGEMGADERRRIERHTRDCHECGALLASLQRMVSTLAGLSGRPTESVAVTVLTRVQHRLATSDDELA